MRLVTIALPDELSETLGSPGQDLSRPAFEALAVAAYRERRISAAQLRQLLGYDTRMEVVREALRRMEDEDDRALPLARPTAEDTLTHLTEACRDETESRVNLLAAPGQF
jgi:chromosome segregation and condensation protein ScpB